MKQPTPVLWYRLLCLWVAFINIGFVVAAFAFQKWQPDSPDITAAQLQTLRQSWVVLGICGAIFGPMNIWLAVAKPSSWFWVAALSNIVAGGLCCPLGWLLLLWWYRPEIKEYFGKTGPKIW